MTTRLREVASQAGDIQGLEPLPEALGLQMLVKYMGTSKEALEREGQLVSAAQLVKKCNGLPIMLRSLAVMCRARKSVDRVLSYLETHRLEHKVPRVDAVGDYDYSNLFVALEGSLSLLSQQDPDAVKRLEMLSIFPEDEEISQMVANRLWGVSTAIGAQTLRTLADWHLVEHRADSIMLLDLHRDYLRCRGKHSLALWHGYMLHSSGVQEIGPNADEGWASEQFLFYHARGAMASGKAQKSPLLPELMRLELGGAETTPEDIAVIAALLTNCELPQLATIGMRDCGIGDQGFSKMAAAFPTETGMPNLQKLDLTGNELTDDSLSALSDALIGCADLLNCLSELFLTDNGIRDQGLAALVAPCKGGRALGALSVLNLGTNRISSVGLSSLSEALAESAFPNLTELSLYENQLDSLSALVAASRRSGCVLRSCTVLDLSSNQLTDESLGAEFIGALKDGAFASLKTLRVGYNETTETCKQALKQACDARCIRLEGVTPHSHSFESAMASSFGSTGSPSVYDFLAQL